MMGFFSKSPFLSFVFSVVSAVLVFMPVYPANAGLFSFIGDLIGGGATMTFTRELNSQSVPLLQAAVNIDPNPSKGGGDITVVGDSALLPETGPSGNVASSGDTPTQKSDRISIYVVREGDSLSQIAKMFDVSVNTIRWANDIGPKGVITPGQTLIILPVSGVRYTVKKGDTLASIVKKYGGDITEVMNFNGFEKGHQLAVGDEVVIPGGELQEAPSTSSGSRAAPYEPAHNTGGPNYDGYYIWPADGGRITQGLHGYNAVDIGVPTGTQIFAAAGGQVIVARFAAGDPWFGGYGNYIVIEHPNGTQTLYAHLSKEIVQRGWNVVQGQVIGYSGATGKVTGPHLHFEVRGAKNPFAP